MPAATRLGDVCTGHGCYPSRPSVSASIDVFTNSRGQVRLADSYAVHCCSSCHGGNLVSGSPNVYVNSRAMGRITDSINCGSNVAVGSTDVFANG